MVLNQDIQLASPNIVGKAKNSNGELAMSESRSAMRESKVNQSEASHP